MNTTIIKGFGIAVGLLGAALLAGCNGSNGQTGGNLGVGNGGNNGGGISPHVFSQIDRLSRPAINEVFATVANNRHAQNHTLDSPTDDPGQLANDIQSFMTGTAGRSQAITDVVKAVIVPDVMKVDLSQSTTKAAYLGVETGGVTGSLFGGRALTDDVIDIDLGVIFGNTIPALGLAPDDGKEIPALTTDNVGYDKHTTTSFPYLGVPQ